jgi:Family of unknown function (DUF5719)
MKWLSPLAVFVLGLAIILVGPPAAPTADPSPGSSEPPVAICATEEGGGRSTTVAITSSVSGDGLVTVFSGGSTAGTGRYESDASGGASVPMGSISAVGEAAALVEFPSAESAAAVVSLGSVSVGAESCSRMPDRQTVVGGANTLEGTALHVQLMNPYATEATVDISAFSESGRESVEALEGIIVPPRSSVIVDVANALPGRESLALTIDTSRGSVVASVRADIDGESAVWRPVAPSQSWVIPAPSLSDGSREVVIVSTTAADVAYQIDVYGPDGLEESVLEGVVEGRGQQIIDLSALADGPVAIGVIAEAPIGVFARYETATGLGIGSATSETASDWFLPGAGVVGDGTTAVVIANVGVDTVTVSISQLRASSATSVVTIEAGAVAEIALDQITSHGVALISDGEIVPFWMTRRGPALAISGGVPLTNE